MALLLLGGCAALRPCAPLPSDTVYLISHGWHTDLALPPDGRLAVFRQTFPGARYVVIGFGRRTFLIAPVHTLTDLLIGPLPGDGALEVFGLGAPPELAYRAGTLAALHLPHSERVALDDAIWSSFRLDADGAPTVIAPSRDGGIFYAASRGYSGLYTCNSWTADMLHRAGLPLSPLLDVFADQTMARAAPFASGGLCRISPASAPAPPARSAG